MDSNFIIDEVGEKQRELTYKIKQFSWITRNPSTQFSETNTLVSDRTMNS